eukprot:GFUD01009740.1.p1 GENE.GFUD01009740.1~~GFUD01009740.1.p1  ORF type:complete len:379 (+),score=121.46 GFUD01009740.1:37-1173(+)
MLTSKVTIRLLVSGATNTFPFLFMSSYHRVKANKYTEHFRTLELPEDTTKGNVRRKYIELVKIYHPDTYKDNSEKFNQIDFAYRELMKKFQEDKEREEAMVGEYGLYYDKEKMEQKMEEEPEESEHPDIQHVAPQHRQFLDNPFGYGSPAQRQKQTQKYRVFKANEAVYEHRVGKLTAQYEDRVATKERATVKKQITKNQIDRLVEDLIQESMAGGEFDNLKGKGQPLPNRVDYNPYTDFTTHKMNQILVETGFSPEWVQLQKEIREQVLKVREELKKARQKMGPAPVNREQQDSWQQVCGRLEKEEVLSLNRMIEEFNLVVPIMDHQKFLFNLQSEAAKIYDDYDNSRDEAQTATKKETKSEVQSSSIFSGFFSMFK